jgi:hypothetical protein
VKELDPKQLVYKTFREVFGRDAEIRRARRIGEEERIGFIPIEADLAVLRQAVLDKGLALVKVLPHGRTGGVYKLCNDDQVSEGPLASILLIHDIPGIGLCVTDQTYKEFNVIFFGKKGGLDE